MEPEQLLPTALPGALPAASLVALPEVLLSVLLSVLPLAVRPASLATTGPMEPLDLLVLNQGLLQVSVPAVAELQLEQQPQGLAQQLLLAQQ